MQAIVALVLTVLTVIDPPAGQSREAHDLATAIATVVATDARPEGWSTEWTATVLAEIAWHESRLRMDAVGPARPNTDGDAGAYCALQVEHRPELARSPVACVRAGLYILTAGAALCPEHPIAPFAGGCYWPGTYRPNAAARRISDARIGEATFAALIASSATERPVRPPSE